MVPNVRVEEEGKCDMLNVVGERSEPVSVQPKFMVKNVVVEMSEPASVSKPDGVVFHSMAREGGRGERVNVVGEKSDPVCVQPKLLNVGDDHKLKYLAKKTDKKEFEIMKACKVVVDRLDVMVDEKLPMTRLTENVTWDEVFERKYCVWKTMNVRFLNLKESSLKEKAKENTLMNFYEAKGLLKHLMQNESWESDLETSLEMKERKVKEIYQNLKIYKTKKKKLDLLKDCKETSMIKITNPMMTLEDLEREVYVDLKQRANIERNLAASALEKRTCRVEEDDLGAKPKIVNLNLNITKSRNSSATKKKTQPKKLMFDKTCTEKPKWKTTLKGTDKKMTPTKRKMTAKTKNSPVAMNVAMRLGLKDLPSVKMMTARLEHAQLLQARTKAKQNFNCVTKPIIYSSSLVVQQPGCTPLSWAGQPMGDKQGQQTGVHGADGPIGAEDEPESCQSTQWN
jgi:hypothetical protein